MSREHRWVQKSVASVDAGADYPDERFRCVLCGWERWRYFGQEGHRETYRLVQEVTVEGRETPARITRMKIDPPECEEIPTPVFRMAGGAS